MSSNFESLAHRPVFFERNRVFRVYLGGKLFGDFFGDAPEDGNYPEEWVASSVKALNRVSSGEKEGVSRIRGTDVYFDELISACPDAMLGDRRELGILVKLLDSAIRLPMQAHPDREFSEKHFNSTYGKAESWIILATRPGAKLYFGFSEKLTREQFKDAILRSENEPELPETLISSIPVKPGDVYFIPAKLVHAIGEGCLILELQEPTDFTIQPEYFCGDYRLSDYEMLLGLSLDEALDCFDYSMYGDRPTAVCKKTPKVFYDRDGILREHLITGDDTPCFRADRYTLNSASVTLDNAASVVIVTGGCGLLSGDGENYPLKKGDYFFLPHACSGSYRLETDGFISAVECRR